MHEVTFENAIDYLRECGWIGPGPAHIEPLGGGVSNVVLRVVSDERTFVIKQSRPQLRTRDPWFSDLARIYREQEVMQVLWPLLPGVVPEVLFVNRENYVYAMSEAPKDAISWKSELLSGSIDLALGEAAGRVLAGIHGASAQAPEFRTHFSDLTVYDQLRIDPFYRRVQERRPEVADAVGGIIEQMLTVKEALCHGDYTPKNFLVHSVVSRDAESSERSAGANPALRSEDSASRLTIDRGGQSRFTLVDYETAHFGDPTMDLGMFTAHIMLKTARLPTRRHDYHRLTQAFWRGYSQHGTYRPADELEQRGVQHLGALLLARIDGTSPVEYLPEEEKRDAVRRVGRQILQWGIGRWEDAWSCAESELSEPEA
jgi:thiamine kinase-like enzyme